MEYVKSVEGRSSGIYLSIYCEVKNEGVVGDWSGDNELADVKVRKVSVPVFPATLYTVFHN